MHELVPWPGMEESVPEITEVTYVILETTAGDIRIGVYPEAAPNAAARFVELVEAGYYDDTPVFRVVPGFVAQFGINWREPHIQWRDNTFDDDSPLFSHDRGTLAFAKAGPNTNSTQVFINYAENNRLASPDPRFNFATFGKIVEGIEFIDEFVQVGELHQPSLWSNGESYLALANPKPTMIERARVD